MTSSSLSVDRRNDRRASAPKFTTTARFFYKLSPRLAPPHYHAPPQPVLPPADHQRALIPDFPQFEFLPRETDLNAASSLPGQSNPPSPSFKLSHMSTMLADPSNWTRGPLTVRNAWFFGSSTRSPWPDQIRSPFLKLSWGKGSGWVQSGVCRSRAPVVAKIRQYNLTGVRSPRCRRRGLQTENRWKCGGLSVNASDSVKQ